ncbi:MAG: tRNA (adenosine(37)-N6)-dimethylallyltransferase MiaA, partial [Erysipelotrichia bacterium]|nr:tRNA (adenosine(37)-N6)-dimethylallyltransferase MiaA [Erysipelotrichia bacterium]
MSKIYVIVGPTGVGKTKISVLLAKRLNAEIINADSVSIYKDFNIGSAKVTKEEMQGVKHHLVDFVEVTENYTVFDFQRDGRKVIDELLKENKNIVIVGGTGLYIKALLYDYKFDSIQEKSNTYDDLSNLELKNKVDSIYPENQIHINNRKRLLRFLNNYEDTGKIIKNENKNIKLYDFTVIGLTTERNTLYERINLRVDKMFEEGLLKEAEDLYNRKAFIFNNIIGYKELIDYFEKKKTLEECIELIKKHTRNYAKRQYT